MDSQLTRLAYEAPKLEVQELLASVYAAKTVPSGCKSSGPEGLGNSRDNGVPECDSGPK